MSIIEEIKQRLDIVEFIGEYVRLQKSGRNFRALCPFHSEKTPSFFVFPEQQGWHCFGACGTGGDIYSFVMKKEGADFSQALRLLAERAGVTLVSPEIQTKEEEQRGERLIRINESAAAYYHHLLLNTAAGGKAKSYLARRGISSQTTENFQLGFSRDSYEDLQKHLLDEGYEEADLLASGLVLERDGGGYYDRFRNRLMFPIRDIKSHVIGFGARALDESLPKYLNSPQTMLFDKSSTLYAIDRAKESIRKKSEALIMEGYMDVLTAHQHGWDNAVASMGTALTEKQLVLLRKLTKNLVLALDADIAGEEATLRMAETIDIENYLHTEVKVVVPSQGKDPDEEIRNDPALWSQSLERAIPMMDFILETVKEKVDLGNAQDKVSAVEKLLPVISKIDDPIRRGHYIQKTAQMLRVKETDLRDRLAQLRITNRKRSNKATTSPVVTKSVSLFSSPIEEYCLGLLLQFTGLRADGMKLSEAYFEFNESKEIFLKWQRSADITAIRDNLDSALHPHLASLLTKIYPPSIKGNDDKQRKALSDCVVRLREKLLKSLELKKAELLAMESEAGGEGAELAKLIEQGIEESRQLKHIFAEKSHRRHSIV